MCLNETWAHEQAGRQCNLLWPANLLLPSHGPPLRLRQSNQASVGQPGARTVPSWPRVGSFVGALGSACSSSFVVWCVGQAEIIPFRYLRVLLGGKRTSSVDPETFAPERRHVPRGALSPGSCLVIGTEHPPHCPSFSSALKL